MLRNLFILSSIFCAVRSVCMNDWVRYEGSCYYFAHLPSERATWNAAVQACLWSDSQLVIIDTKAENDFIKRHLAELNPEKGDQFWTFGNDIHGEGVWNWGETQNPIPISLDFWHPGEPNQSGGEEDCLTFYTNINFDWNDEHCDRLEYYICELSDNYDGANIIG